MLFDFIWLLLGFECEFGVFVWWLWVYGCYGGFDVYVCFVCCWICCLYCWFGCLLICFWFVLLLCVFGLLIVVIGLFVRFGVLVGYLLCVCPLLLGVVY